MSARVTFDVEIRDPARYQVFMQGVKPALEAAGARYLARGEDAQALQVLLRSLVLGRGGATRTRHGQGAIRGPEGAA